MSHPSQGNSLQGSFWPWLELRYASVLALPFAALLGRCEEILQMRLQMRLQIFPHLHHNNNNNNSNNLQHNSNQAIKVWTLSQKQELNDWETFSGGLRQKSLIQGTGKVNYLLYLLIKFSQDMIWKVHFFPVCLLDWSTPLTSNANTVNFIIFEAF